MTYTHTLNQLASAVSFSRCIEPSISPLVSYGRCVYV